MNLLVPNLTTTTVFAGVRTALLAASGLASRLGFGLRVLSFGAPPSAEVAALVASTIGESHPRLDVCSAWRLDTLPVGTADVWVATYWTTAHALDVAARNGVLQPERVVYLVQDYEPSFYAASSESSLARSTYHAGFRLLVNSKPLGIVLTAEEGLDVSGLVFRPHLDLGGVRSAADLRRSQQKLRIGFYGRPSKPRNSFALGVSALRATARELRASGPPAVEFVSVGESHRHVDLGYGHRLASLGKLPWEGYFEFLASCTVMFSLQQTPHPSHIPFDAIASGGFAVTNEVMNSRSGMSERLIATAGSPTALAAGVLDAARLAADSHFRGVDTQFIEQLGEPLDHLLDPLAAELASDTADR